MSNRLDSWLDRPATITFWSIGIFALTVWSLLLGALLAPSPRMPRHGECCVTCGNETTCGLHVDVWCGECNGR